LADVRREFRSIVEAVFPIALAAGLALSIPASAQTRQQEPKGGLTKQETHKPTLQETTSWLSERLSNQYSRTDTHRWTGPAVDDPHTAHATVTDETRIRNVRFDGCKLIVERESYRGTLESFQSITCTVAETVALGDIVSGSIAVEEKKTPPATQKPVAIGDLSVYSGFDHERTGADIDIVIKTKQNKTVHCVAAGSCTCTKSEAESLWLLAADRAIALRVVAALRHATDLCASSGEPF
jgi:hypothetical protein